MRIILLNMNFGRECYRVIKRYQGKDDLILKQKLTNLYRVYTEQGLDKDIADKIKQTILKLYAGNKPNKTPDTPTLTNK